MHSARGRLARLRCGVLGHDEPLGLPLRSELLLQVAVRRSRVLLRNRVPGGPIDLSGWLELLRRLRVRARTTLCLRPLTRQERAERRCYAPEPMRRDRFIESLNLRRLLCDRDGLERALRYGDTMTGGPCRLAAGNMSRSSGNKPVARVHRVDGNRTRLTRVTVSQDVRRFR